MLWPQVQRAAKRASPKVPLRGIWEAAVGFHVADFRFDYSRRTIYIFLILHGIVAVSLAVACRVLCDFIQNPAIFWSADEAPFPPT
jgi:hypothetical protein